MKSIELTQKEINVLLEIVASDILATQAIDEHYGDLNYESKAIYKKLTKAFGNMDHHPMLGDLEDMFPTIQE